jgi:hypothetical protein
MTPFETMAHDLDELAPRRAAAKAAPRLAQAVRERFAHGQLRGLTASTTAHAAGASVVLTVDDRLPLKDLHLDPLPADVERVLREAVDEEGPR